MSGKLSSGLLYIILIIFLLTLGAMTLTGGIVPINAIIPENAVSGDQVIIKQTQTNVKNNLQLQTFNIQTCQKTLAVDFLVDVSSSMEEDNKISKLKQALTSFLDKMTDNSVVGMQSFSTNTRNIADIGYFKDNKAKINTFIKSIYPNGYTYTRDAFSLTKQKLSDAITQNKFPGRNYSLIFISDGIPTFQQDQASKNDCLVYVYNPGGTYVCFSKREDPRIPTDISQEIKDMGVKIFSIEIYGQDDAWAKSYEDQLFQDVSSKPLSTYYYETLSANDLPKIFDTISNKVCQ